MRWSGIVPPYRDTPIVDEAEDSSACQRSLAAGDGRTLSLVRTAERFPSLPELGMVKAPRIRDSQIFSFPEGKVVRDQVCKCGG